MYFNCHSHTHFSNIRLIDSINKPKDLINAAIDLGLSGIAITDHESISGHIEINQIAKKIKEKNLDFTIALGNEIYLIESRETAKQKYYHFILIAKDEIGHKALRELSSVAWLNSYSAGGMRRVPLLKSELSDIYFKYKGHLIATTACMGGELGYLITKLEESEKKNNEQDALLYHNQIVDFISYCKNLFEDDFYLEIAPSSNSDQIAVNKRILNIARVFEIPITIGTDAHYLTKEDREVHKAYLNSKNGEREVDSFYEFARLMSFEEAFELLKYSFDDLTIEEIFNNSNQLKQKISFYDLEKPQKIPKIKVTNYKQDFNILNNYDLPYLKNLLISNEIQERYWVNECLNALNNKNLFTLEYLNRLEIEAKIIKNIGDKLNDCLFAYFNTFQHYIDLFWECGSTVGPGRGSATGFLSNYLLGITQLDPIRWNLNYWRFLNEERVELPSLFMILGSCKKRMLTIA